MTIEAWGAGKPDYFVPTVSTPPRIVEESTTQESWVQNTIFEVGGFGSVTNTFYTVPSGYNLSLNGGYISANTSVINRMRILDDSTVILGDYRYDMRGDINYPSGQTILTGHNIYVYLWNNDNEEAEISVTLFGVLERA